MKKGMYLFSLVAFLVLAGTLEAVSGFVLWFAIPSGGGRRGAELAYLGLTRHTWIDIHDWVAVALALIVVIHFMVHWKWVSRMIGQIILQSAAIYQEMKSPSAVKIN